MVVDPRNPSGAARSSPPPVTQDRIRLDVDARSAGDLAKELTQEASLLIRQEIQLAKLEMTEKLSRMGRNIGIAIGGGLVAYAGFLALVQAAVNGLGTGIWRVDNSWLWLAVWLSPLVIGLLVVGIGYAMLRGAMSNLKKQNIVPEKTMETMRENKQWLENQVK
jgi:xanthine/uracil permease